jgi:hypothetical protein
VAGGAVGTGFFHLLPFIEQDNLYNASYGGQYWTYVNGPSQSFSYGPYTYNQGSYTYTFSYTYKYSSYPTYVQIGKPKDPSTWVYAYWASRVSNPVKTFLATNDPSLYSETYSYVSYLMNAAVFDQRMTIQQISDGSSNTVFMAEGYTSCYGYTSVTQGTVTDYNSSGRYSLYNQIYNYDYTFTENIKYTGSINQTYNYNESYSYYTPKFSPVAGKTFQVRPPLSDCDASVPQGFSSGGVQVLLGDGSVRTVSGNVSTTTWAAALTPNGGDVLGGDW